VWNKGRNTFGVLVDLAKINRFAMAHIKILILDPQNTLPIHQVMSGFAVANILTANLFVMAPTKIFNPHIAKYFNHAKPCQ
jgi:hypothetical protein